MTEGQTGPPVSADREFQSNAKVTAWGVWFPREGTLTLADGRLTFKTFKEKTVFDVAVEDAARIKTSWYMWGTAFSFKSGSKKHQVSFNKLSSTGIAGRLARTPNVIGGAAEIADMRNARALCNAWKKVLRPEPESRMPSTGGS